MSSPRPPGRVYMYDHPGSHHRVDFEECFLPTLRACASAPRTSPLHAISVGALGEFVLTLTEDTPDMAREHMTRHKQQQTPFAPLGLCETTTPRKTTRSRLKEDLKERAAWRCTVGEEGAGLTTSRFCAFFLFLQAAKRQASLAAGGEDKR